MQQNMDQWFTDLYRLNASKMVRYAYAQLRRMEIAEELVEDAFVMLLRKQDQVAEHPNPSGWLWKTLQHLILTELRSAKTGWRCPWSRTLTWLPPSGRRKLWRTACPRG